MLRDSNQRRRAMIWALWLLLSSFSAFSQDQEGLRIEAPGLERRADGYVVTLGRSRAEFEDLVIYADEFEFDQRTGWFKASGNILMEKEHYRLMTDVLHFNRNQKTGFTGPLEGLRENISISGIQSDSKDFFEDQGDQVLKVRAKSSRIITNPLGKPKLELLQAEFTNCSCFHLHRIVASKAVISDGEKVELYHLRPKLFGLGYLYFPYLIKDLQYDWPWTRWTVGNKAEWGPFGEVEVLTPVPALKEKSILTLGWRQRRGLTVQQDWTYQTSQLKSRISAHAFLERWKDIDSDEPSINQDRYRLDFFHRQKLNPHWTFLAEFHKLTERKKYFWKNGADRVLSENRFVAPIPGATQVRESLFKEYYEEEFRRGRSLQNQLSLDYKKDKNILTLSTELAVDEEEVRTFVRPLELRGRTLATKVRSSSFLYSNDYGILRQGYHFGDALSEQDSLSQLGVMNAPDFLFWRGHLTQKVERSFQLGQYLLITPSVGSRSMMYDAYLSSPDLNVWNLNDGELQGSEGVHRFSTGMIASSSITGLFSLGQRRFKHQIRPSVSVEMLSPTSFDKRRIPIRRDSLDASLDPELSTTWRLDQQILMRQGLKDSRLVYASFINFLTLGESKMELERYGSELKSGEDLQINQKFLSAIVAEITFRYANQHPSMGDSPKFEVVFLYIKIDFVSAGITLESTESILMSKPFLDTISISTGFQPKNKVNST